MRKIFKNAEVRKYVLIGTFLILLYWGLNHYMVLFNAFHNIIKLLLPFLIGIVIAFILNVPMMQIENKLFGKTRLREEKYRGIRRILSFFLTLLIVIAIITIVLFIVIPQLAETIGVLLKEIPIGINKVNEFLQNQLAAYPQIEQKITEMTIDWDSIIQNAVDFLSVGTKGIISGGIGAVNGIVSGVTTFLIGFVFSVYILFQKENLSRQLKKVMYAMLRQETVNRILEIVSITNATFSSFLSGQCLEAVILGSMFFVSMTLLRLPYALLIGVLITVTALIPIVGAFIGCFTGILLIGLESPVKALGFVVLFLVLQQIEGNLIYPHVVGNSVGLPGIWVLVAVTIGGNLFGIVGMLTFIPICSVLYSLFRIYINNRLKGKNIMPQTEDTNLSIEKK